ncbi:MAG: preprotein translocase subunit SecG [Muribaculaceae bacterium]|nr:preprotein translocase subunit SecG [Muribaculaceae bacterium]
MYVVVIVLTVIVAVLLIGIVLIQKSKGGGLSSQFGGAGSVMGVRQTNSFLEKTTWTLAGLIALLSIISAYTMPKSDTGTRIRSEVKETPALPGNQFATPAPEAPVAAPAPVAEQPAAPATEAPAAE